MGKDVKAGIWLFHISMRSASKLLQKNRTGRLPRPDGKAVQQQHADEFQSRMDEALGRLERLLDQGYGQNALQDGDRRQLQLAAGSSILQRRTASHVVFICFASSHSCPCRHPTALPHRKRDE